MRAILSDTPLFPQRETYGVTNESVDALGELFAMTSPRDVLSIAGGGEQPLLVFLSRGIPVTAVDYNPVSLAITLIKAYWLGEEGPSRAKEALRDLHDLDARDYFQQYVHHLPLMLQIHSETALNTLTKLPDFKNFQLMWLRTPDSTLECARANLENLCVFEADVFSHEFPKFGLVYLSNAPDFDTKSVDVRVGRENNLRAAGNHLEPGGYLMVTSSSQSMPFPLVASRSKEHWNYYLLRNL